MRGNKVSSYMLLALACLALAACSSQPGSSSPAGVDRKSVV